MQATVLSIAGSDPTGGAGIQADLKTMTSIGVYGAAAVTCITVQNSFGVSRIEYLSPDLVAGQIQAVLDDHYVTHIKIGMVGTVPIAGVISGALTDFQGEVIYDPVMVSSTGQSLLNNSAIHELLEPLVSKCTVLTPNLPELSKLTLTDIDTMQNSLDAARQLLKNYPDLRAVLVKGGHVETDHEMTDYLLCKNRGTVQISPAPHRVINTRNSHGTGCTLASAFASFHCITGDYEASFHKSVAYTQKLLSKSARKQVVKNPNGIGGMLHYLHD